MIARPYRNFHLSSDDRGITTVWLNVPRRPLNILTRSVMQELESVVQDLEESQTCKLAVFISSKESGFLAGADVSAIAEIESSDEATELIKRGQALFLRIERLPMSTVAAIHGPCLGGGLELALACNHRVALDSASTQIGLPEIKLGLIPGWGGTQRLPRVVGLRNALSMILTGRSLGAKEAIRIGLLDEIIDPNHWAVELDAFVTSLIGGRSIDARRVRTKWIRKVERHWPMRPIAIALANRKVAGKRGQYPALPAAIRAIAAGFDSAQDGFGVERSEFAELLQTSACRNLLSLFVAREKARNQSTWSRLASDVATKSIHSVGVVGAGAMGAGIAQLVAIKGYPVAIKEVNPQAVAAGSHRIEKLMAEDARHNGTSTAAMADVLSRITINCEDSSLSDCDLVIEAVIEREDVKAEVFRTLDQVVQENAILASNTSSLSVSRMAEVTERPTKIAGLHFFNPVRRMELVEVVRTSSTNDQTIARLVAFVRSLGKTPIVTTDSPGFLVNRVLFPYLGEAILMVQDGYSVEEIDDQIRRFGMPMGPLELLDHVGLDVAHHVAKSLDQALPDMTSVINKLAALVQSGQLGTKGSRGFYEYRKGKRRGPATMPFARAEKSDTDKRCFADDGLTPIQRRLIYPMLSESVRCLEEGVVAEAWMIDLAMVLGTGFAPHLGGPLHVVDSIGANRVVENLCSLREQLGQRFAAPKLLVAMGQRSERFMAPRTSTQPNRRSEANMPSHSVGNRLLSVNLKESSDEC